MKRQERKTYTVVAMPREASAESVHRRCRLLFLTVAVCAVVVCDSIDITGIVFC
jgi:hypothetical protein